MGNIIKWSGNCPKCNSSEVEEIGQEQVFNEIHFKMKCLDCGNIFFIKSITVLINEGD